ncbi:MAG TPA: malto-oligosyltrehalose trehalohydrolase [Pirellulales bacterium]|nr:malto-oligosyltrehalose trehalohydrolase [Pirellulales bacterium]
MLEIINELPSDTAADTGGLARRLPVGAELLPAGGVHVRVWCPERQQIEVVLETAGRELSPVKLSREVGGYFSGIAAEARAGDLYRFRLDGQPQLAFADPASRFQPEGPFGPSQVVDPSAFAWTDDEWGGVELAGQVIYEMHIGTFTPEGTWQAARQQLPELARAGITLIEMMPVADFPGQFGWGYDGVNHFAPTRLYGAPDELRAFIDAAHGAGLGVILDVVYNHLGSAGNLLPQFARYYSSDRHKSEWGEAVNFDGPNATPVREFVLANVRYWIEEFHFDGLRLDATQAFYDDSPEHILGEIGQTARAAAGRRGVIMLGENEPQQVRMVRKAGDGGHGLDALWNDDFHHSAVVRLTGRREAYYSDYFGTPEEFLALAKWGFLYQGQNYPWQRGKRGTPTYGLTAATFVNFIENHDQLANSARGERIWRQTSPGRFRAATAYLLLGPGTPMLFQGQEFSASSPFLYFADCGPELADDIAAGRARFLAQFRALATPEMQAQLVHPCDPQAFERSKLDFAERQRHADSYALHRDLLRLRREDPVFRQQAADRLEGARLSDDAFLLRFFGGAEGDRLLVVNFGCELRINSAPQPLLAPVEGCEWRILWSSEAPHYGGNGAAPLDTDAGWWIPGEAAVALAST